MCTTNISHSQILTTTQAVSVEYSSFHRTNFSFLSLSLSLHPTSVQIPEMGLEISIFESAGQMQTTAANQQPKQINLLAETVIPLESAIYSPNSEWWPLLSTNFNQQINSQINSQINTQPTKPNVNTNFAPIAKSGKQQQQQQLLTTNQLQDRCVSAEYLCK